jgi:hypothetical protein
MFSLLYFLANYFDAFPITITLGYRVAQRSVQTFLINNAKTSCAKAQANPAVLLYVVELLSKQVQIKGSLSSSL